MSNNKPTGTKPIGRTFISKGTSRDHQSGGADRDRTDDLKLAKLALSQLSYGPDHALPNGYPLVFPVGSPGGRANGGPGKI